MLLRQHVGLTHFDTLTAITFLVCLTFLINGCVSKVTEELDYLKDWTEFFSMAQWMKSRWVVWFLFQVAVRSLIIHRIKHFCTALKHTVGSSHLSRLK